MEAKLALGDLGAFGDDEMSVPSFQGYAKQWLEQYAQVECKPSTQRSYEQLLRLHVTPRFGQKKLTEITRESLKQFASDLSRQRVIEKKTGGDRPKFSRNSLRLILGALRSVLNGAIEDGLIQAIRRLRSADLPRAKRLPNDPRHTYGSLLIQGGASLVYVKEQMGHSSIQVTVDT